MRVQQGDAFLLQTHINKKRQTVLVDAGKNKDIVNRLSALGIGRIDVLACSHRDSDHAEGIKYVLETFCVRELWLPSDWGDVITTAFMLNTLKSYPPKVIFHRKYMESCKIPSDLPYEDKLRTLISHAIDHDLARNEDLPVNKDFKDKNDYEFAKQTIENLRISNTTTPQDINRIVDDLKKKFNLITEIIQLAYSNCSEIRWFKYGSTPTFCCRKPSDPLLPLNAREAFSVSPIQSPYILFAQLSKPNIESLVFSSRRVRKRPPIMFCADSNLDLGEAEYFAKYIGFKRGGLITTPHHGSKSNQKAFERLRDQIVSKKIRGIHWVRGQNHSVTIGSWYSTEIEQGKYSGSRYCTKCSTTDIVFRSRRRKWIPISRYSKCNCK